MTPDQQRRALGAFIRSQRELANMSLRRMAALAEVSNPYLSQIERGLHEPSMHVLRSIAEALNLSAETILEHAGLIDAATPSDAVDTEMAIRADRHLSDQQKQALLAVYRSYRAAGGDLEQDFQAQDFQASKEAQPAPETTEGHADG